MINLDQLEQLTEAANLSAWENLDPMHVLAPSFAYNDARYVVACDPATIQTLIRAARLLPQVEWAGEFGDCPICEQGGTPSTGLHADGCELDAALTPFRK